MEFWENSTANYSVSFIHIQGILFLFIERFWSLSISFIFFRCLYDVHVV